MNFVEQLVVIDEYDNNNLPIDIKYISKIKLKSKYTLQYHTTANRYLISAKLSYRVLLQLRFIPFFSELF